MNKKKSGRIGGGNNKLTGIIKITAKPLGFLVVDGLKSDNDVIIFEENLNCALDKDEVEVEIIGKDRDRKKGRVTKIIKRSKTNFVGTLEKPALPAGRFGNGFIFVPDDFKFYKKVDLLPTSDIGKLEEGVKVLAEINWTNPNLNPKGKILKIVGKKGDHETEMQSILLDKGIVYDFPTKVEEEAQEVARKFRNESGSEISEASWERTDSVSKLSERRDFRNITTFTIDPKDAKDFDDALSYEDLGGGPDAKDGAGKIRVGVHIADVSHFVRPGTALDAEALDRSFSTYLVDRTIPMLPEVLSNELCSLMPNVDRFAFSAVFDIKKDTGEILDRWFGKTIINSNKRFSYEEAQELLTSSRSASQSDPLLESVEGKNAALPLHLGEGQLAEGKRDEVFRNPLSELNRIAKIYREENKKNGAIEFETDEVRFELDEKGAPVRIYKKARLDTMKMIEEWMLLANREVAKFISDKIGKKGGAGIFRIHKLPKMERIEELAVFVRALGHELPIKNGEVTARDINALLKQIEGHASESLIKTATIRSMAKAVYSTKNIGHFGLAFKYYTHFTSPIRRYPDLMIHRILERYLNNEPIPKNEFVKFEKIAQEASDKEVIIAEAERDSIKYKQVEFMQNKIGQEFDVVISGVTEWGMYVEDPETKVEGLVRIKDLGDDFYKLDQKNYCIVGQNTKKKFSLGDSLRVTLTSADLDRKTLDFKLV
ncbi:MAG: RNB domain-containing ribonuclease [Candidatus Paceibacterota bacterium]|jgi:exoribonuclease R